MILEDKFVIFTRVDTVNAYSENIGFEIVELIRDDITKSLQNSGYFCSTFHPIFIPNYEDTDAIKLRFVLYNTYKADLIILIPIKASNDTITNICKSIDEQLKFYLSEKSKTKEVVIR